MNRMTHGPMGAFRGLVAGPDRLVLVDLRSLQVGAGDQFKARIIRAVSFPTDIRCRLRPQNCHLDTVAAWPVFCLIQPMIFDSA